VSSGTFARALTGLLLPGILAAQDARDSSIPRFESLLADPQMTAMGGRVLWLNESDSQLDDHWQAEAILGENLTILSLARGAKPVSLGMGGSVTARFGLTADDSPMVAHDWRFQVNVNHRRGPWVLVAALWHESYHLGDEYIARFGQEAKGGAREGLTAWAFYRIGSWRLGASATGSEARAAFSARLGFAVPVASGAEATFSLAGYHGPSTLGFFRNNDLRYL
jgi:hypothetical protein